VEGIPVRIQIEAMLAVIAECISESSISDFKGFGRKKLIFKNNKSGYDYMVG
jgi:hypothetical protein